MQLRNILWIGLIVALLAGCAGEKDVVTMSELPKVSNQFTPKQLWKASVGNGSGQFYSNLHPTGQTGAVYAADRQGLVKAFSSKDGKLLWQTQLADKRHFWQANASALLSGGLTISGDSLYVGSEKGVLYAVDTDKGKLLWKTNVGGEALSAPVVSDGFVLVHTSNGLLQALNQVDGTIKWTANMDLPTLSLRGESSPAVAFGAAIVGGDNGQVNAVLMQQGQFIWQQRIADPKGASEIDRIGDIDQTPVIVDQVVYAVAYNGDLAALDLRSGQPIWKRPIGAVHNFIVDGDKIYLVDQNDRVLALSRKDGMIIWSQSGLLHRLLTAPVLYHNYLVAGDSQGYLHWMNTDDGRFVAQQKVNSAGLLSEPTIVDDQLIIQAKDGDLYAFSQ